MHDFRADLHCHTTCSDGTVSPKDMIHLAGQLGLRGLAITDHDTLEAYREATLAAQQLQFDLISGVELSATHQNVSIHILAYSFPLNSTVMMEFCKKHHERRIRRIASMLELLEKHNMPLTEEDLYFSNQSLHSIGRPHIALAMIKKGYVKNLPQAFHEYLGDGKPCYSPGKAFTVEETLDVIHQAGGLAVIAHPHLIDNHSILNDLLHMQFDGIEGYYGRFALHQQERFVKIGMKKGWIITGGSDFHGEIKPNQPLGSSWVNEETFTLLKQHFLKCRI